MKYKNYDYRKASSKKIAKFSFYSLLSKLIKYNNNFNYFEMISTFYKAIMNMKMTDIIQDNLYLLEILAIKFLDHQQLYHIIDYEKYNQNKKEIDFLKI